MGDLSPFYHCMISAEFQLYPMCLAFTSAQLSCTILTQWFLCEQATFCITHWLRSLQKTVSHCCGETMASFCMSKLHQKKVQLEYFKIFATILSHTFS